ncbi:MAG: DUF1573 domain-containing protein [Mucinivorans sp.]
MKKYIILYFLFLVSVSWSQMRVVPQTVNFGEFSAKNSPKAKVMIYNDSKKPLVIKDMRVSCVCTKLKYSPRPVMPGDSTLLEVTYVPNASGQFYKTVEIISTEPTQKIVVRGRVL